MYKTAIIDDEINIQNSLKNIITEYCDKVEIIGTAENVAQGIELILNKNPEIVFLDIDMPDGTGFDLLQNLNKWDFSLIFCTAFNEYAIKAFKYNAIDYILKPFDIQDVVSAAQKAVENTTLKQKDSTIKNLLSFYQNEDKKEEKIILKTSSDIYIVKINEIYHCQADGSYTIFNTIDNKKITVSNSLKEYESILKEHNFIRVHQSHLVNLNFIDRIHKTGFTSVVMKNGKEIPISTRKKEALLNALEKLHKK